jgi:hypothetical protein
MKSLTNSKPNKLMEQGKAVALGIHRLKVEQQKNAAKAEKRQQTMLERAAEKALSGRA